MFFLFNNKKYENIKYILFTTFLALFYSCNNDKKNDAFSNNSVFSPNKIDTSKLQTININKDSLLIITPGENGIPLPKTIKASKPTIKHNTLTPKLAGSPKVTSINHALKVITPGKNGIPLPKNFLIPDTGYSIQNGDTVYAPITKTAGYPLLTNALPSRYKDAATYNVQYLDVDQGMPSSYIRNILQDKRGNIWFGTSGGGASRYDGKSFTNFTEKEGLLDDNVNEIFEDKDKNLWFCTSIGGLSLLITDTSKTNGEKYFQNFTTADGLPQNLILSITQDSLNRFWLGTEGGNAVFTLSIENNGQAKIHPHSFYKADGLQSLDAIFKSIYLDKKNRIWWGMGKELTMLDLTKFELSEKVPTIQFTGLDINETFIAYQLLADTLQNSNLADQSSFNEIKFSGITDYYNYPQNL